MEYKEDVLWLDNEDFLTKELKTDLKGLRFRKVYVPAEHYEYYENAAIFELVEPYLLKGYKVIPHFKNDHTILKHR